MAISRSIENQNDNQPALTLLRPAAPVANPAAQLPQALLNNHYRLPYMQLVLRAHIDNALSAIPNDMDSHKQYYAAGLIRDTDALRLLTKNTFLALDCYNEDDFLPLTPAGRLAYEGHFTAAQLLVEYGANEECLLIGAACGGHLSYFELNQDIWMKYFRTSHDSHDRLMGSVLCLLAAYHNHTALIDYFHSMAADSYRFWPQICEGALMGNHYDYIGSHFTSPHQLQGICPKVYDGIRDVLSEPADAVEYLVAIKHAVLREWLVTYSDTAALNKNANPSYLFQDLLPQALRIEKIMIEKSLDFTAAKKLDAQQQTFFSTTYSKVASVFGDRRPAAPVSQSSDEVPAPDAERCVMM